MKKSVFIVVLSVMVCLFISAYVGAVSTDMRASYQPGETAVVELSGNILEPIAFENVIIKRNNVQIATDYDVKKLGEKYYIWFTAPKDAGNYTLWVKNLKATVEGTPSIIDFSQNFSVAGSSIDYSITPGFITTGSNFQIMVKLYGDRDVAINIDFPDQRQILVKPTIYAIDFDISSVSNGFTTAHIGHYAVPVYIMKNISVEVPEVAFSPLSISRMILINEKLPVYNAVTLTNLGKSALNDVYFDYDNSSLILNSNKFNIGANESKEFNVSIIKGVDFNTKIYLRAGNNSFELPVGVVFEKRNESGNQSGGSNLYRCSELRGKICTANEVCSTSQETSLDGSCCTGECTAAEPASSGYSWVGYIVVIIVLLVIGYVFMKYKRTRGVTNPVAAAANIGMPPSSPPPMQRAIMPPSGPPPVQRIPGMP